MFRVILCVLCVLCGENHLFADLPSPRLDRIAPLGAAAGTTVEVTIVGADLEGATAMLFDSPGITAKYLKDKTFAVTVAASVEPGTYDLWCVGRHGISNPRLFAVQRGLDEIAKAPPGGDREATQRVPMNAVVNGLSDSNREDKYLFAGEKGRRIVFECRSAALDTMMDANLALATAGGKVLATNGDHDGRDPLLDVVLPDDGDYVVSIFDLSYRGGFPYRLSIADRPHVETAFPRAVQFGKPTAITFLGRNLGAGTKPSKWSIGDSPLDAVTETITFPAGAFERNPFHFEFHPTTHSVLPTAATGTLVGRQVRGVPFFASEDPVTLEAEPNDTAGAAQTIVLPAVVAGRFDVERDADWYEFTATADGPHSFAVHCERIAGRADPYLVVADVAGKRIAEFDDFGHRILAFDGHLRDPVGSANLVKGRKYRVLAQDRYRRGGVRFHYVLTVRPNRPDFFVAAIHHQNPGPGGLTLRRGGTSHLDLAIHRMDGFAGPIAIAAEGLPKGVRMAATTLADGNQGAVVFECDADAPAGAGFARLVARGRRGEDELVRDVRIHTRVSQSPDYGSSRPTRGLAIATIAESAPFALAFERDRVEIEAGRKVEIKLKATRIAQDFRASIVLLPLALPGSIRMTAVAIGEGKGESAVAFEAPAGTKPGDYMVTVLGQAQVPYRKDAIGPIANTLVTTPARPLTVVVRRASK